MTHDVVPSDLDLAERLLKDGHSDEQILSALNRRRVDPESARRLIQELRNNGARTSACPGWFRLKQRVARQVADPEHVSTGVGTNADLALNLKANNDQREVTQSAGQSNTASTVNASLFVAQPWLITALEVLLILYMLDYSHVINFVSYCISLGKIPIGYDSAYFWITRTVRLGIAVAVLGYILYQRRRARREALGAGELVPRRRLPGQVMECVMVLLVAFWGPILSSFRILSSGEPLQEPPLTIGETWTGEAWHLLSQAGELGLLAYVL
jgi:hypothetical protein